MVQKQEDYLISRLMSDQQIFKTTNVRLANIKVTNGKSSMKSEDNSNSDDLDDEIESSEIKRNRIELR